MNRYFSLLVAFAAATCSLARADGGPWTYIADWTHGFSGWMSFPLSQDVGYDPSLFVENEGARRFLIRRVVAHGEKRLQLGFLRPLEFTAGPDTRLDIEYQLETRGSLREAVLMLAGADGRHYSAPLPNADGRHTVQLNGRDFKLGAPTRVMAIMLRGRLAAPQRDSISLWTLDRFALHAHRTLEVGLDSPQLTSAPEGIQVAREVLRSGEPLKLGLKAAGTPVQVALFDDEGKASQKISIPPGQASALLGGQAKPGLWRAELKQGSRETSFRFLVLGKTPPHPRVLLSRERMAALRDAPEYSAVRQQIHGRAEKLAASIAYSTAVGSDIELMPSGSGIFPAFPGQLKPYMEVLGDYGSAVVFNALDYRLNGNRKGLDAARRALLTTAQWKAWVQPRFRNHGLHTYYEIGVFTQLLAFGYDLVAQELSPEERSAIAQAFWEKSIAPTIQEYFLYNRDPIGATNHAAQSIGGALAAAVAVAGDYPGWDERERPALAQLACTFEELLDGLFPGDGSEAEPIGYENFALQGLSWGMSALDALGVRLAPTQRVFEGFWWPYYVTPWRGRQIDTGDFDGHLTGLSGFAWISEHSGIPQAQQFYRNGTQLDLSHGAEVGSNGHGIEQMLGPLDLACCSGPAPSFTPPPASRVFPLRGSAALRSGWEPGSTVISLRAGPWFNHEHHDQGTFQVAAFGEDLIAEAGHANYYTDPRYPDYFTQASGHNTVLVDNDPFSQQAFAGRYWPGFAHPHFLSQVLTDWCDYLSADLTAAYDGTLRSYRREFVFLKPDVLIVRDRLSGDGPHTYSWLLHAPAGSDLEIAGARAAIKARKASVLLTAAGANVGWKQEPVPIPAELFTDLDHKKIPERYEFTLESPRRSSGEFLVGMKFVPVPAGLGSGLETLQQPAGEGFKEAGGSAAEIMFRTGAGTLQAGGLTSDGEILARRGSGDRGGWFAAGARQVREGAQNLFVATTPADVAQTGVDGLLYVHNSAPGSIIVFRSEKPKSVEVDGHTVSFRYESRMIGLGTLAPGEHRVSIH